MKINVWIDRIDDIRKVFKDGLKLTEAEFEFFKGLGLATNLDPFRKEIQVIKYGAAPAQIFVGRDGYRTIALKHPDYDYHQSDCVYDNDAFEIKNGEVNHCYNVKNRGKLMGAYCIVKRKSSSKTVYHFVNFIEYTTGKNLWASKPETMIKKVSEAHSLRAAFPEELGGTYIPEEVPEEMTMQPELQREFSASEEQLIRLRGMADKHSDRIARALEYYKAERLDALKEHQASQLLARLEQREKEQPSE